MKGYLDQLTQNFKSDFPSSLVVFLVALPLCLGIAFASDAPLVAGLIAGIVGGLVVSMISGAQLSVSGPAAGLTSIVAAAIMTLGSFEAFVAAVAVAGIIQIALGLLKAGTIGLYFPSNVIKGMLAGIGITLILKQLPHAVGYDKDYIGDFTFFQQDQQNTFSEILIALEKMNGGAAIIAFLSLAILILWERPFMKKVKAIPGALVVVAVGIGLNLLFESTESWLALRDKSHLVQIPVLESLSDFSSIFTFPDFSVAFVPDADFLTGFRPNKDFWLIAFTVALVASIESLLSIEAVDKLDPDKRISPPSRELVAQGIGNTLSGLLGGLPMTAVIVRGATNVDNGAKTRWSSFMHGIWLLLAFLAIPNVINYIPLGCLAAILIVTGYKLTKIKLIKEVWQAGWQQFTPFVVTALAIVLIDLLWGIGIGMTTALLFILHNHMRNPYFIRKETLGSGRIFRLTLGQQITFLNRARFQETLANIPPDSQVIIDANQARFVDYDIIDIIRNFQETALLHNIKVSVFGMDDHVDAFPKSNLPEAPMEKKNAQPYEKLFQNNRNWIQEKLSLDPEFFTKMAKGQQPNYLFIGCSDSRVPANEITGTEAGEMFVHRNIANLVVHTDMNLMSVLQYSIDVLKVEHVIVCGHYGCGGVRAAVDHHYHGLINKWLRNIQDVYRIHQRELDVIQDPEKRHRKLVELNVREQVYHVFMTGIVQNAIARGQQVNIHGWVYDIADGHLKDLSIDIERDFEEIEVYRYELERRLARGKDEV